MSLKVKNNPDNIILLAQKIYPQSFDEVVASRGPMQAYYREVILRSGIADAIEDAIRKGMEPVTIVDMAGGRGRAAYALRNELKERGFSDESIASKVNYVVVDVSKKELGAQEQGAGGWKSRVLGNIMKAPLAKESADFVLFLNTPVPLTMFRGGAESFARKNHDRDSTKIVELLEGAIDSVYNINLLEGMRVLKVGGVMVDGAKYFRQTPRQYEDNLKGFPLHLSSFSVVELDKKIIPALSSFGRDVNDSQFVIATCTRKSGDVKELTERQRKRLELNLSELSAMDSFESMINNALKEMGVYQPL